MTTLEQVRSILREYLALEIEYTPIAGGWARLQLRGAARKAWLKKKSVRLGQLREQLTVFANAEAGGPPLEMTALSESPP